MAALTVAAFAPIGDKPDDAEFYKELSDSEMSRYQTSGAVTDAVTEMPRLDQDQAGTGASTSDKGAAEALARASSDEAKAQKSLQVAEEQLNPDKPNVVKYFVVGGLFLVVGAVAAQGVKYYMDKSLPAPPTRNRW